MNTRKFVSPRHKSRGDPRSRTGLQSGQAIVRESAERPVIKLFLSMLMLTRVNFIYFQIMLFPLETVVSGCQLQGP